MGFNVKNIYKNGEYLYCQNKEVDEPMQPIPPDPKKEPKNFPGDSIILFVTVAEGENKPRVKPGIIEFENVDFKWETKNGLHCYGSISLMGEFNDDPENMILTVEMKHLLANLNLDNFPQPTDVNVTIGPH